MLKAVFFDLDGTLLSLKDEEFVKLYFKLITSKMINYGFEVEELSKNLWAGNKLMYKNDGSKTNEEVFWDYFKQVYGEEVINSKAEFDKFYTNEFKGIYKCIKENKISKEIVKFVKDNNLLCILSTNPLFPRDCTLTRMSYNELFEEDFDYITSYENSNYTKPNPFYFIDLLHKFNLKPEEVILIGNNELEDAWCSRQVGIDSYIINEYLITSDKLEPKVEIISLEEVISVIQKEINKRK